MNRILCFALPCVKPMQPGDVDAIAVDAEGRFLTGQVCSSAEWAKLDLGVIGPADIRRFHGWFYRQRYGDDCPKPEWAEHPPENWDGQRDHTEESLKPWHLDPANGSSLYREEAAP